MAYLDIGVGRSCVQVNTNVFFIFKSATQEKK